MDSKKGEQERDSYNRLISQKEEQLVKLSHEERKIEKSLRTLEEDLHKGFQGLKGLSAEASRFGGPETSWLQQENEEQERSFRQLLCESDEEIASAYKKETRKMDDERETLYTKRSEIPWD